MKNLTKKQKGYVENVTKGFSKDRSAIMAGASPESVKKMEANPGVMSEINRIRAEVVKNTGITREEIVQMFLEAANFARITGDPMAMIAAARELGKMLGHYAPEVKKTLHGIDKNELKKALRDMSEDELYRLANAKVIDGEVIRDSGGPALPDLRQNEASGAVLQEKSGVQELYPAESEPD